jgi:hypothetical protein
VFRKSASSSVRVQIDQLIVKHRETARFEDHDGRSGLEVRPEGVEDRAQLTFGRLEKSVVVQRPTAAERSRRQHHLAPRVLEQLGGRNRRLRMKVVVEGIRPEHDLSTSGRGPSSGALACSKPGDECLVRKARQRSPLRDASDGFDHIRQPGRLRKQIDRVRRVRGEMRPAVDEPHRVR